MRMLLLELCVDALDNFADLRHDGAQKLQIPLFQRLGHDGVVRVGEDAAGQFERSVEVQTLVNQQTDKLRDRHGRVRVVELDGDELRQAVIIRAVLLTVIAEDILQGRAGEDILLLDAQALALPRGVVRVQNTGDILGLVLLFKGLNVVLRVESIEVQFFFGLALPEAERADGRGFVADDGHVIRDAVDGLVGKADLDGQLVAAVAPRIAVFRPVVGVFTLAAVYKRLLEQAEAVAQAVAGQRQVERRGAVKEAGGETAKSAVAEGRILNVLQARKIDALFSKGRFHPAQNAEVEEVAVD